VTPREAPSDRLVVLDARKAGSVAHRIMFEEDGGSGDVRSACGVLLMRKPSPDEFHWGMVDLTWAAVMWEVGDRYRMCKRCDAYMRKVMT
jgi:hypothetical protein